jgi:hypothetical protein
MACGSYFLNRSRGKRLTAVGVLGFPMRSLIGTWLGFGFSSVGVGAGFLFDTDTSYRN